MGEELTKTEQAFLKRIKYYKDGLEKAEADYKEWQEKRASGQVGMRKQAPKYMTNPFKAHLDRLDEESLHSKAWKQYDLYVDEYESREELTQAMVAAEFGITENGEVEEEEEVA